MHFAKADLTDVAQYRHVIATARDQFGRIDALVNVAAITDRGTILDTDPTLFERMFAIKTRAPFFLLHVSIKLMIETQTAGTIVNISSMSAMGGQPFIATYCASKGAVGTLTRNTAFALLKNRNRVNALNIGWMSSDGEDRIQREHHGADEDWLKKAAARQPFGRLVDPANFARACASLSSQESALVTCATINSDRSIWGAHEDSLHPRKAIHP